MEADPPISSEHGYRDLWRRSSSRQSVIETQNVEEPIDAGQLLLELNNLTPKLASFRCPFDQEDLRLSLQIATPALQSLTRHLGRKPRLHVREHGWCASPKGSFLNPYNSPQLSTAELSPKYVVRNEAIWGRAVRHTYTDPRKQAKEEMEENVQYLGTFKPSAVVTRHPASADVGSKREIDGEMQQVRRSILGSKKTSLSNGGGNSCYIAPDGNLRVVWDAMSFILITLLIIIVPFELSFLWETETDPSHTWPLFWWFAVVVDFFFLFDIFVNFFTAFYSGGPHNSKLITAPRKMFRRYINGWFAIDVISTFPFSRIMDATNNSNGPAGLSVLRIVRFAKAARILKVFRVVKLGGIVQLLEEQLIADRGCTVAFHLFKYCLLMLIQCHAAACLWYAAGYWSSKLGYTSTWLDAFTTSTTAELWMASFYFCITTASTVGYGDISACNSLEMLAGCILLIGSVYGIGQMISKLGQVVGAFQERKAETLRVKRNAMRFMRAKGIPRPLYRQVLIFLDHTSATESLTSFEGSGFLEYLSDSLQSEIRLSVIGTFIKSIPVFSEIHDAFIKALCHVTETRRAGVGDIVAEVEQSCDSMVMIVTGEFSFLDRFRRRGILRAGDWFGERCLFFERCVHNMTVTCEKDSELLMLYRNAFLDQLTMYPKVKLEYDKVSVELKVGGALRSALLDRSRASSHLNSEIRSASSADSDAAATNEPSTDIPPRLNECVRDHVFDVGAV